MDDVFVMVLTMIQKILHTCWGLFREIIRPQLWSEFASRNPILVPMKFVYAYLAAFASFNSAVVSAQCPDYTTFSEVSLILMVLMLLKLSAESSR